LTTRSEFQKAVYDGKFRVLLSQDQIGSQIQNLAREITRDYEGKTPILIGVLNGGFMFLADLIRHIELDLEIDFIKISSYGDGKTSSGQVQLLKDVDADLSGRHVLIVEDIVDTSLSIKTIQEILIKRRPASLKFVVLLLKHKKAKIDFKLNYVGFNIDDDYVVGYGLDYKQMMRNFPSIYIME
jgi:hypoxanthine phosphoribosyltransferase